MFTELIGKRSFLSDCSAMAMDRWGSLSAFQLAKNKNGMAFVVSYFDFNGRLGVQFDSDIRKLTMFLAGESNKDHNWKVGLEHSITR